jgi:hypothetical protein
VGVERLAQGVGVDHVALVGLVDRALQNLRPRERGEVEERPNRLGEGDVAAGGDRLGGQGRAAVAADSAQARFRWAPEADVDVVLVLGAEPPEGGGAAMAQRRTGAAGEHRRHPAPVAAQASPTDRVDAAEDRVQAAGAEAMPDRALGESKG